MAFRIPSLEYSLSHPHPKGRHFLIATLIIFILTLPALILVNLITQGSELVPSLQSHYQPNKTLMAGWWGAGRLPSSFQPKPPRCQPKDIGRGDTFRLTTSLFDYTVMSTLNKSQDTGAPDVQEQIRAEYKGQNFSSCGVNSARFDYSLFDQTQSMTVGVLCPNFPEYPVNVSMQTTITFAWELSKDFIGQYYGPGLDLLSINDTSQSDYRKVVLAVLQVVSTDSLTIMRRPHISNTVGSMRIAFNVSTSTGVYQDIASTLTYANGTQPDPYPAEAAVYDGSISNLLNIAIDAVRLDLGIKRPSNLYQNATRLSRVINPNLAPEGTNSSDWVKGLSQTFYYGGLNGTQYETWAQALLNDYPVKVGNLTGLPEETAMATTYLCPMYQGKPLNSLLSSVFIGSATMTLSVWGTWMFFTAFVAKKLMAPRVQCECEGCIKRELGELKDENDDDEERGQKRRLLKEKLRQIQDRRKELEEKAQNRPDQATGGVFSKIKLWRNRKSTNRPRDPETGGSGTGSGTGSEVSGLQRPNELSHSKHLSEVSTITMEKRSSIDALSSA